MPSSAPPHTAPPLCVLVAYGTRPEVIKLAPVVRRLHAVPDLHVVVAASGQHRELAAAAARELGVEPDHDLAVPRPDPGLNSLFARLLTAFDELLEEVQPDWLLVQGDTSTACAAALAAFHRRVRIGHVEAGLRTGDLAHPFPEEANRRWIDAVSDELFAPTAAAAAALAAEGAASRRIHLTGNTAIDTLLSWPVTETVPPVREDRVLVTVHRRESFGPPLAAIAGAVRELARRHPATRFHCPLHPNPEVAAAVREVWQGCPNLDLCPPLSPHAIADLLPRCRLVMTDSGGLQEEAPTFGTPVLILRERTERPEGVAAGLAVLAGVEPAAILAAAEELLAAPPASNAARASLYGDGRAAERIVAVLLGRPWEPFAPPAP